MLAAFFPSDIATRKLLRKDRLPSVDFAPDSFFGSRKIMASDITGLCDYLNDNFSDIQSGVVQEASLTTNIPLIAERSMKLLASTEVRPSGGQQKSSQHASISNLCMNAIFEAVMTEEYRQDILKGAGGKLRRAMEDIVSRYTKDDAPPGGLWVDGISLADIIRNAEPEVLETNALKTLESNQDRISVREKHKMQIEKMVETMEAWDFVQAHKKHPAGTIDEGFMESLHALMLVGLPTLCRCLI